MPTDVQKKNVFSVLFRFSAQTMMKGRLMGAQKGHSLLKKKADALQMRFRMILSKIIQVEFFISHPIANLISLTNNTQC